MPDKSPTAMIRNLARSGQNYRTLRTRVEVALRESGRGELMRLTPFLAETFFSITSYVRGKTETVFPLNALPLTNHDWSIIERLLRSSDQRLDTCYLRLAADYVLSNLRAIDRLRAAEVEASNAILDLHPNRIASAILGVDPLDAQSLFAMKLYCAVHADAHKTIADHFAQQPHSDWVKRRLLHPMIYYFINMPSDQQFEHMLEQLFATSKQVAEKAVVGLLLRNQPDKRCRLSLKCYVALLCHPFDALNTVTSHFEETLSENKPIPAVQLSILRELADSTKSERLCSLLRISSRTPLGFEIDPTQLPICARLSLPEHGRLFLERFVSCRSEKHPPPQSENEEGLYGIFSRLRWNRLPTLKDFTEAVAFASRFGFCEVGRLLKVLLTSIYMVERGTPAEERQYLIRQADFFGCVSPFMVCSPRGASALYSGFLGDGGRIEARVDEAVRQIANNITTRWWIKKLHWALRKEERGMHVHKWLRKVRESTRLSGNLRFLSGIDWTWVDQVIAASRIRPFAGNPDGIYVLLLRAMEQRQREPNILRLALQPRVSSKGGLATFTEWLVSEFGADAIAFIRFFLSPAMILKLKLEPNYTAALSERLNALDLTVERFGLNDDILSAEQYSQEQWTLTTALTFMTVGAAQFEISWETFRSDAFVAASDNYKTFAAFNKTYNELPILSTAIRSGDHIYRNKQSASYEFPNRSWPIVLTIVSIIDTFLSHPAYGIEAILAIRIRHDNLRREFALIFAELRRFQTRLANPRDRAICLDAFEEELFPVLQEWIDRYMHSPKKGKEGIFDFVPTQDEMATLVQQSKAAESLDSVVNLILEWVRGRLSEQLKIARVKFRDELCPKLITAIDASAQTVTRDGTVGPTVANAMRGITVQAIQQRCDELVEWFKVPVLNRQKGLTFDEIRMAVEHRFAAEITDGELLVSLRAPTLGPSLVPPDQIRWAFDLWSEITTNVLKYRGRNPARLRVSEYRDADLIGLRFSSHALPDSLDARSYQGQVTTDGPMLRTGKSGLIKVAAIASSMLGCPTTVRVIRRRHSFHVFVPLQRESSACLQTPSAP